MPDTPTPTAPPPTVGPDALRIVLFGMPAAGKSSLLGALAEAAQAQEHLLHGRLADLSHGLDELRHRLYDETQRRTVEEIVPYPITYEPYGDEPGGAARRAEALLIDCDGRVANDLLVRHKSLEAGSPEGTLAHEVSGTIGNTPMVALRRMTAGVGAEVLVKLEYMNPGGSVKDRIRSR